MLTAPRSNMTSQRLASLLQKPEVREKIIGSCQGAVSLGVTRDPDGFGLAIQVRVEGQNAEDIPGKIELEGEEIPILVSDEFEAPQPLNW